MANKLNANNNLCKWNTAEEFKEDSPKDTVPFNEELTICKTEVKEEVYDFEMAIDNIELRNVKEEYIFLPENNFNEENLEVIKSREPLLSDNHGNQLTSTMADSLNVNTNLYKQNTGEEFREESPAGIMPFHQEITIMKTEVKEEVYNFEMPAEDTEFVDVTNEHTSSDGKNLEKENLEVIKSRAQSLNENLSGLQEQIQVVVDPEISNYEITDLLPPRPSTSGTPSTSTKTKCRPTFRRCATSRRSPNEDFFKRHEAMLQKYFDEKRKYEERMVKRRANELKDILRAFVEAMTNLKWPYANVVAVPHMMPTMFGLQTGTSQGSQHNESSDKEAVQQKKKQNK